MIPMYLMIIHIIHKYIYIYIYIDIFFGGGDLYATHTINLLFRYFDRTYAAPARSRRNLWSPWVNVRDLPDIDVSWSRLGDQTAAHVHTCWFDDIWCTLSHWCFSRRVFFIVVVLVVIIVVVVVVILVFPERFYQANTHQDSAMRGCRLLCRSSCSDVLLQLSMDV